MEFSFLKETMLQIHLRHHKILGGNQQTHLFEKTNFWAKKKQEMLFIKGAIKYWLENQFLPISNEAKVSQFMHEFNEENFQTIRGMVYLLKATWGRGLFLNKMES